MDQIYPLPGVQSCSDDIDNWVDKTIEKEIQRGKKLQQLKQHPTTRNNKYHVVSIKGTNFYCEKKQSKRRSQSPTKQTRKIRNHSPHGTNSPPRKNKSKKDSQRCPMRTAELAVPSKRHCIETWQNNYHVLPGIMIDRLKHYVFDIAPVVKIPDAIECFERCENSRRRKRKTKKAKCTNRTEKNKDKSNRTTFEDDPKVTARIQQQRQDLCIYFGIKIAKKLYRPTIITLNPELERISNVITKEIEQLMRNEKKYGRNNELRRHKDKRIEAEVIAKITVWISDILDDTADKIIEDQLLDLDEEIGPVLDFLDELIDKVVDICEPEPVIVEISSSSETYNVESSTEYVDDGDEDFELVPKESRASLDLDIFLKRELDFIIDSFDKDHSDVEIASLQNVEDNNNNLNETEGSNNAVEAEKRASIILVPDSRARHILKGTENDTTDDTKPLEVNEQNEFQDANDNLGSARNEHENEESNADQGTEVNDTINLESNEVGDDDLIKKVKFSEKGLVTNYDTAENENADSHKSDFMNPDIVFAEPNDHLLSDADESWPEDIISPVVRPSVSVSKSISSLGFVVEAEERTSIILFDTGATHILKKTENDTTDDTKLLEILGAINDPTTNAKTSLSEKINDNVEAMPYITDKDTSEIAAETYGETEEEIKERTEQGVKYRSKDPQKIEEDLAEKFTEGISQRASTDSTFIGEVSSEPITFKQTLKKITENEAAQAASQSQNIMEKKEELYKTVHDEASQASKPESDKTERSDKTTHTSFSLIQRENKSTSVVSQSLADIAKRLSREKPEFSSLRIKPKVDYKVNKDSAPAWVTQNFSKPKPKEDSDKHIRLWCKDLQTGFENLELWNEWLENTLGNVEIMERDKARIEVYESRQEFIREWIHLKKNVDADVVTWIRHSHSTQEKIKCFRKVCKNFQEPSSNIRTCNCNKK